MREYEVVLIALPDLDETNLNTTVDKVKAWITNGGGTVSKVDKWGKRRLTFAIRKQREGQYVLIMAEMDPKFTSELERNLRRQYGDSQGTIVISAGEMSDPLACDVLGYMPQIVEMFGRLHNVRLLLLTKSGVDEIQPLLGAHHNGHAITAWSITCEEVVRQYESGNESIANRLAAAKAAQDVGYEVRFRLDPMMVFDGWQDAFARTVEQIYRLGIHPSRFTLGSFRLLGNLRGIIKARFPESDILQQPLVNDGGKRQRYPHKTREELYIHAIACIREHDDQVAIALCKETPEMHRVFDGLVDATKCNCLP